MQKKEWRFALITLVLAVGISFAGCSKKVTKTAPEAPLPPSAAAAQKNTETAASEAKPAEMDFTFEALCNKLVSETKAANSAVFTAALEKQSHDGCMAASKGDEKTPKAHATMVAYIKTIMTACAGKSGAEWLACYGAQVPNGAKAAMDAAK